MKNTDNLQTTSKVLIETFVSHEFTPNRKDNYLSNKLVFGNANFSRVEQRLWEFFLNQVNHGEIDPSHGIEVSIPISLVNKYILPKQIKAVTKIMIDKSITFSNLSSKTLDFKHVSIFRSIEYNFEKSGLLIFRSSSELSPYLIDLGKAYAKYDFKTIQTLKSSYSVILYKIMKAHLGQNRKTFVYSIKEIKELLQIEPEKYPNLHQLKIQVLNVAQMECANLSEYPIIFEYEHEGGKERGITHLRFNIITSFDVCNRDKQDFLEAAKCNPEAVKQNLEEIIDRKYHFTPKHKQIIINNSNYINQFATLHIEFENGLYPKVKNKTAYILTCIGLVNMKAK